MRTKSRKILLPPLSTKTGYIEKSEFFRAHYVTGDGGRLPNVE